MKVCPRCKAVYDGHRWIPEPDEEFMRHVARVGPEKKMCPGDQRLERRQVEGVVRLEGAFMLEHQEEIRNLVDRVARQGRKRNVAARIFEITLENGALTIETTDDHLAERIGKEVEKAFKGDLEIKWQEKDHFVRVVWKRG